MRAASRRFALSAAMLAPLALGGCAATSPSDESAEAALEAPQEAPLDASSPDKPVQVAPQFTIRGAGPTGGLTTDTVGLTIHHDDWSRLGYRWDWAVMPEIGAGGTIERLMPGDDLVIVQDSSSRVNALETGTGRIRWALTVANSLTKFVSVDRRGDLLLASTRPTLFVLDINSGNLLARQPLDKVVSTRPVILGGTAMYGTPTGWILAHTWGDRNNRLHPPPLDRGIKDWAYAFEGAVEGDPVLIGDTLGVVTQDGDVSFLDFRTASRVGRARIAGGVSHEPVADDERMYIASLDQSVYAIAPQGGEQIWRKRTAAPIASQPTIHQDVLYVVLPELGLTALDAFTGEELWNNPVVSGAVIGTRRGELIVSDVDRVWMLDDSSGDIIHEATLPGVVSLTAAGFEDGPIYAVAESGGILRFIPR